MKLKDFVNQVKNKKTNQERFDLKKRELKKENISVNDLLDMDIPIFHKRRIKL